MLLAADHQHLLVALAGGQQPARLELGGARAQQRAQRPRLASDDAWLELADGGHHRAAQRCAGGDRPAAGAQLQNRRAGTARSRSMQPASSQVSERGANTPGSLAILIDGL